MLIARLLFMALVATIIVEILAKIFLRKPNYIEQKAELKTHPDTMPAVEWWGTVIPKNAQEYDEYLNSHTFVRKILINGEGYK